MLSTAGSPSVAAVRGAEEFGRSRAGAGSSGVAAAAAAGGQDSQNLTSVVPATLDMGRVPAKVRHSVWQAGVMSSPAQAVGIR
jgi:hypothetical protein